VVSFAAAFGFADVGAGVQLAGGYDDGAVEAGGVGPWFARGSSAAPTVKVASSWAPYRAVQSSTHLLIIAGLGGEQSYSELFHEWSMTLADAAEERYGVAAGNVLVLTEAPDRSDRIVGRSSKEEIEKAFATLASRTGAGDAVMVVLIGHGSYNGGESKLSLPGPDLTAADFAVLLDRLEGRRVALVNTASASGEFVSVLAGPDRAIVAATKSGMERNQTTFPRFFVRAFADDVADTDKDGRVSLLEAFTYARLEVERFYESEQRLLTEHAVLDDDGDGEPIEEPAEGQSDGALAASFFLGAGRGAVAEAPADASPALRALYAERQELERQIAALRARRDTMPEAEYQDQLEALLVDLSLKTQEIRALEGRSS
jgi:hypothetical protein